MGVLFHFPIYTFFLSYLLIIDHRGSYGYIISGHFFTAKNML